MQALLLKYVMYLAYLMYRSSLLSNPHIPVSNDDIEDLSDSDSSPSSLKQIASRALLKAGLDQTVKLEPIEETRESIASLSEDSEERQGGTLLQPIESLNRVPDGLDTRDNIAGQFVIHSE